MPAFVPLRMHEHEQYACVSEYGPILSSPHCELRAEPTWCDICEGREIIYMTLPLIGAQILI